VRRGAVVRRADIPVSDHERVEGFQRIGSLVVAVAVLSAVVVTLSERGEGFQRSGSPAVAVLSAVAVPTASERVEGFQHKIPAPPALPESATRPHTTTPET